MQFNSGKGTLLFLTWNRNCPNSLFRPKYGSIFFLNIHVKRLLLSNCGKILYIAEKPEVFSKVGRRDIETNWGFNQQKKVPSGGLLSVGLLCENLDCRSSFVSWVVVSTLARGNGFCVSCIAHTPLRSQSWTTQWPNQKILWICIRVGQ